MDSSRNPRNASSVIPYIYIRAKIVINIEMSYICPVVNDVISRKTYNDLNFKTHKEMKSIFKALSILAAAACMISCGDKEEPVKDPVDDGKEETQKPEDKPVAKKIKIKAMSFNIKYPASSDEGDRNWDNRKTGVIAMLQSKKPDVVGLQECYIKQRTYILENLSQYDGYGLVRNNGTNEGSGETMSVLWNKNKYEKVDCGTFWLSETPDEPSKGWGAANFRDCTWILLKEKETGKMFYHFNTHLDHQVEAAQTGGAKLIRQKMNEINKDGYPVILTGDMNVAQNSPVCALFEMDNARTSTTDTDNNVTCHGYGGKTQVIDHIFSSGLDVWFFQTVNGPWDGYTYISDHNPVMAEFEYK